MKAKEWLGVGVQHHDTRMALRDNGGQLEVTIKPKNGEETMIAIVPKDNEKTALKLYRLFMDVPK